MLRLGAHLATGFVREWLHDPSTAEVHYGHISDWDTSRVRDMSYLFRTDEPNSFNSDLSMWNVARVTDMSWMFYNASAFQSDLSQWDTRNVRTMSWMFYGATAFNQPLPWNTSNVLNMSTMFQGATAFNQPLRWNTSKVHYMESMFYNASAFQSDLSEWDTCNVMSMAHMFENANSFNSDLSRWNVARVLNMSYMFSNATSFNQPLKWDTRNVRDMQKMFLNATAFNQPLPWNTSNVLDMSTMFQGATAFNQPLRWNTSKVQYMESMFESATAFDQPLNWDTSNVRDMSWMFRNAPLMLRRYPSGKQLPPIDRWEQVRKEFMHGRRRWHWQEPCEVDQNVPLEVLRGWADEFGIPLHHPDTQRPKTKRALCADLARWWDAQREEQRTVSPTCHNPTGILGENVDGIPPEFFYHYTHDDDGPVYCDDIRSLHKHANSTRSPRNPYNRQPYSTALVEDIRASYERLNRRAVHLDDFDGPANAWLSFEQRFSQKLADLMVRLIHPVGSERLRDASEDVWAGFLNALVGERVLSNIQRDQVNAQRDLDQQKFFAVELLVHKIDNDPDQVDTPQGRLSPIAVSVSNVVNRIFGVV